MIRQINGCSQRSTTRPGRMSEILTVPRVHYTFQNAPFLRLTEICTDYLTLALYTAIP
jgi:hypothetical protein